MASDKKAHIAAVIGSGRSGTHLLGQLIATSKMVTPSIEDDELFPLIKNAAAEGNRSKLEEIAAILGDRLAGCKARIYLEKSHPLLWFADDSRLYDLPIKYIGIIRDPYATVASMLKHSGVRRWCEEWEKLPQPNIFLGTSQANLEDYRAMTITQRCAMRWIGHTAELKRLRYILTTDRYLLLNYEDVVNDGLDSIKKLEEFLGIKGIDKKFSLNKSSLGKWKTDLSPEQVRQISEIIQAHGC